MTEAAVDSATPVRVPRHVVDLVSRQVPILTDRVAQRVQAEIPAYSGTRAGRRHKLITMAVGESAALFVRRLTGRTISSAGVDNLFRRMGYGEGAEGHDIAPLEKALRLAGREAWKGLQQTVIAAGLPAATLGHLGDELTAFLDHLTDQARAGHAMATRLRERDVTSNQQQLVAALLAGAAPDAIRRHAELAGWALPASAVVIAASANTPVPWPDADDFDGHTLICAETGSALLITPADHANDVIRQLCLLGSNVALAHSWPVPLAEVAQAHRWTTRALRLVAVGALPHQQVIDCARFRTQLWLHAEPALRRQLAQELLKPLFAETPNSREILSETLLVWLETRESAPAIAAILGVHPQTVRYRWRRINELFGEALHDAEFVVQLTMVLKASVPLWVAGDQSDFERYWSEEPL